MHEASGFSPRKEREGGMKEGRKGREKERGRETDQTTPHYFLLFSRWCTPVIIVLGAFQFPFAVMVFRGVASKSQVVRR